MIFVSLVIVIIIVWYNLTDAKTLEEGCKCQTFTNYNF